MIPRQIAHPPSAKTAANATNGANSAVVERAPATAPTNPMVRTASAIMIALPSDMARLCRVVRGAPR